jgi:hypothetical protein
MLLFFVTVYFGAYVREAVLSPAFPVPGTLFSAFARSKGTLFVMLLSLWSPVLASSWMAITSRRPLLMALTLLILLGIGSAYLVLYRRSYFAALKPPKF